MPKPNLHKLLIQKARQEIGNHFEEYDGELCFNLFTYLERLESVVEGVIDGPTGRFELDGHQIARYLYCCLCLEQGEPCDGTKFRGMPILD